MKRLASSAAALVLVLGSGGCSGPSPATLRALAATLRTESGPARQRALEATYQVLSRALWTESHGFSDEAVRVAVLELMPPLTRVAGTGMDAERPLAVEAIKCIALSSMIADFVSASGVASPPLDVDGLTAALQRPGGEGVVVVFRYVQPLPELAAAAVSRVFESASSSAVVAADILAHDGPASRSPLVGEPFQDGVTRFG